MILYHNDYSISDSYFLVLDDNIFIAEAIYDGRAVEFWMYVNEGKIVVKSYDGQNKYDFNGLYRGFYGYILNAIHLMIYNAKNKGLYFINDSFKDWEIFGRELEKRIEKENKF